MSFFENIRVLLPENVKEMSQSCYVLTTGATLFRQFVQTSKKKKARTGEENISTSNCCTQYVVYYQLLVSIRQVQKMEVFSGFL